MATLSAGAGRYAGTDFGPVGAAGPV